MKKMKKRNLVLMVFIALLWSIGGISADGQDSMIEKPAESGEEIELFVDRAVYASNESIYFSAFYQAPVEASTKEWSTVLYVELIKWDGSKLVQAKVSIVDGVSNGAVMIPANIESGNYYLRAYTKWMRNYSPYQYTYLRVKVINPFTKNIDKGPEAVQSELTKSGQKIKTVDKGILVSNLQNDYGKRESASLEIEITDESLNGRYCVSVTRLENMDESARSVSFQTPDTFEMVQGLEYLPEISGLSLSGKVVDSSTGEPVDDMKVNLSSYSTTFFFSATNTDSEGKFVFTLPHYEGSHELHNAVANDSSELYEILLTSEFCNQALTLPYVPFRLGIEERAFAKEITFNAQVCNRYSMIDTSDIYDNVFETAFYGKPSTVILSKDYIELIDLKEFFYELVHSVSVGIKNKKSYLIVHGETSLVSYPPLILMDNIPVKNDDKLLEIPSRMIERIEVINSGYIIGDYKYNGIISIFSVNRDMAGLEMEENSHFFKFRLFDEKEIVCPVNTNMEAHQNLPDRRNLLFWNPDLSLSLNHTEEISFSTPDVPGEYVVSMQGIDSDGAYVILKQLPFTVK
jgi:hypothetical protein